MRFLSTLILLICSTIAFAQTVQSNAIMDQSPIDLNPPCAYCSPWRFDLDNQILMRWNGSMMVNYGVDTLYVRADSLFYRFSGIERFAAVLPSGGGGSSAFLGLTDTPSSYTGQANKMVLVNPTSDGLIFADTDGLGGSLGIYWNGSFADTTWLADYSAVQQKLINASLREERLMPKLTYSIPIPDSVFKTYSVGVLGFSFGEDERVIVDGFDLDSYLYDYTSDRNPITGVIKYVTHTGGSSNNADGDKDNPYDSVARAILNNADVIFVEPGLYDWNGGFKNLTFSNEVTVIGRNGTAILSNHDPYVWTLTAAQTNTYETTLVSGFGGIRDTTNLSGYGLNDFASLTSRASIAEVEANPNSYFVSGSTIYVHTHDSRTPDAAVLVFRSDNNCQIRYTHDYFLQNLEFWGGNSFEVSSQASPSGKTLQRIFAKNCAFRYNYADNGVDADANGEYYFVNCYASSNALDGFNYHSIGSIATDGGKVFELNCKGFNNGRGGTINNGSTAHEAFTTIRINGEYYENGGANVHDIQNTKNWLLNCELRDSSGSGSADINLRSWSNTWAWYCLSKGSATDFSADNASANLRLTWCYRNWVNTPSLGTTSTAGGGTITVE